MGAGNVKAAYALWRSRVDDRPFSVLAYMALRSLDTDQSPVYFGGHEELASAALGRLDDPASDAAQRAVRRCVKHLTDVGALALENRPRLGERAIYSLALRVTGAGRSVTSSDDGEQVTQRPPMQDAQRPAGAGHSVVEEQDAQRPPKEYQAGEGQDLLPGIIPTSATKVTDAGASDRLGLLNSTSAAVTPDPADVAALVGRLPGLDRATATAAVQAVVKAKNPDSPSRYMAGFSAADVRRWAGETPQAAAPRHPRATRRTCPTGSLIVREPDGTTSCCEHCTPGQTSAAS